MEKESLVRDLSSPVSTSEKDRGLQVTVSLPASVEKHLSQEAAGVLQEIGQTFLHGILLEAQRLAGSDSQQWLKWRTGWQRARLLLTAGFCFEEAHSASPSLRMPWNGLRILCPRPFQGRIGPAEPAEPCERSRINLLKPVEASANTESAGPRRNGAGQAALCF